MHYLSNEPEKISGLSFWRILGRRVFSRSGTPCGRVIGIRFKHVKVLDVTILYNRWTLVRIHSSMIQNLEDMQKNSFMILNVDPFYILMNRTVFDHNGQRMGRVRKIKRSGYDNSIDSILVKDGFFSKSWTIPWQDVAVHKKSIILKEDAAASEQNPSADYSEDPEKQEENN